MGYVRHVAEPIPPVAPVTRARWEERSLVSMFTYYVLRMGKQRVTPCKDDNQ